MARYSKSPSLAIAAYEQVAKEHREKGEYLLAHRADLEACRLRRMEAPYEAQDDYF